MPALTCWSRTLLSWTLAMCAGACGTAGASSSPLAPDASLALEAGDGSSAEASPDLSKVDAGVLAPKLGPSPYFPYVYTDDEEAEEYARFRAEGLAFDEAAAHLVDYASKYRSKRRTAPSAEVAYFEKQRELLAKIRAGESVPDSRVSVGFAGDIMSISDSWDSFLGDDLRAKLAESDLWLANLETPIAESVPVGTTLNGFPIFNSAPGLIGSFRGARGEYPFATLSVANNHSLDFGDTPAAETLAFLAKEGIPSAGLRVTAGPKHRVFERGGLRLGVYAATWGLNDPSALAKTAFEVDVVPGLAPKGRQLVDLTETRRVLDAMAADRIDVKVVFLHWGNEYEMYPDPQQLIVARELVVAGADVIVGAHPHVAQPSELCFVNGYEAQYDATTRALPAFEVGAGCVLEDGKGVPRKSLIVYSLGNFITSMNSDLCRVGVAQTVEFFRSPTGRADFRIPSHFFVWNEVDFPPDMGHRSMLLSSYLGANCFATQCPDATLREFAYLRRHLGSDRGLEAP